MAVDLCHITSERGNELRRAFERWARAEGLRAYDQRTGEGFLRHLVMREGRRTGQILAQLVTAPGELPGVDNLARELPEGVVGVVHSVNDGVAEVTTGLPGRAVIGVDEFEEQILGLSLRLSAGAFMQTNSEMCDVLYGLAIEYAELQPDDVAWDLYCGAGAIGLLAAPHVRKVVGVEISEESVARAHDTAERNGIANAEFVQGDVAKELRPLLERVERPSVVFVDPPRAGLTPRAVRRLIELAPERIVYVSCNPTTLAPNGRQLADAGYTLERVRPVDMFPHTHHIECVARFTRGTAPQAA
jgi:23S rRNA (uracil1939-C5)-methyltransferase